MHSIDVLSSFESSKITLNEEECDSGSYHWRLEAANCVSGDVIMKL